MYEKDVELCHSYEHMSKTATRTVYVSWKNVMYIFVLQFAALQRKSE